MSWIRCRFDYHISPDHGAGSSDPQEYGNAGFDEGTFHVYAEQANLGTAYDGFDVNRFDMDPLNRGIEGFNMSLFGLGAGFLTKSLADGIGIDDAFDRTWVVYKTLADESGVDDSFGRVFTAIRTFADEVGIDDSFLGVLTIVLALADEVGIDDSFSKIWTAYKTLADDATADDAITKVIGALIADGVSADDAMVVLIRKVLADEASADDAFSRVLNVLLSLADEVGIHDVLTYDLIEYLYLTLADEVGVGELSALGDLLHASGLWAGHRYFDLMNDSRWINPSLGGDGWSKTTMPSDGWTKSTPPSGSWTKQSQSTSSWTKRDIGVG